MNYRIIGLLIIVAYIAIGVFINAIIVGIDKYSDAPHWLIILLWPIFIVIVLILLAVFIVPVALGERIGKFIKKQMKG